MQVTERERYFFDLNGFLLLKGALSKDEVADINAGIDALLPIQPGEWKGYVHGHNYGDDDGINLQQIYEGGEAFEKLIDHPSWIEKVKYFVGGDDTFDYNHGPLFIDECFASLRGPGEAIGLHSGAHHGVMRNQFRYFNGRFHCGQINILMALTDIAPGDGSTMVVPGSHKSHFPHPDEGKHAMHSDEASVDNVEGAVNIYMEAGDAILFVDAICHGSAERVNPGQRRIIVFRYGPSWGRFRFNYQVSDELIARLTPERRQIVRPQGPQIPGLDGSRYA